MVKLDQLLISSHLVAQRQGRSADPLQYLLCYDIQYIYRDCYQHLSPIMLSLTDGHHPNSSLESHLDPQRIHWSSLLGRDLPIRSRRHFLRSRYEHHRYNLYQIIVNLARDVW